MSTQVIINGKEITNPVAKISLAFGASVLAALIIALIMFALLPLIGIGISLSVGFVAVVIIATSIGMTTFLFGAALFGWLFGPTKFQFKKIRK